MEGLSCRPATVFDALDFAGGKAFLRKVLVYSVRKCDAYIISKGADPLSLAMLHQVRARRVEFAMFVKPAAQKNMVAMVRLAHLTLSKLSQSGVLVYARVRISDARAQRMARLTGFMPGNMRNAEIWLFRGPKT
jgi:hypothetical protein